jgi:imidazolonepropionase-like amidohydrolase
MKKLIKFQTIIYFILVVFSSSLNAQKIIVNDGLRIDNCQIITYHSNNKLVEYKGTIVIDSTEIVYTGVNKPDLKGTYDSIDAKGKYIIPGLIDSHVHLANMAGMNPKHQRKHPKLVGLYFEQLPKSFLFFGYTTLIDVNNYAPHRLNNLRKKKVRPDIYACGEQVQVMDDFMMVMEEYSREQRYLFPFLHDHYNENIHIPDSIDLRSHTAKEVVKNIIEEQNGICVKTLYEDAYTGMKVTWAKPSVNILKEIADEARKSGIPTIIHAPSFEGQKVGLEAGIDIIAHAMWNWFDDPLKITDTVLPKSHANILKNVSRLKIGYQPTYRAITGEIDVMNKSLLSDKNLLHVFHSDYLSWLKSKEGQWLLRRIMNRPSYIKRTNPDFYNVVRSKFTSDSLMMERIYNTLKTRIDKVTLMLAQNNANLLFGTDFGVMNMYTAPPGYSGFLEMQHWADAGVDLKMIFKSATYNNAKAFNLNGLYGTIEKGKIANLLILNSNPLKTITAYNDIDKIILHGNVISRIELSANK